MVYVFAIGFLLILGFPIYTPFIIAAIYERYNLIDGTFPPKLKYTRKNLMKVYLCFSVVLIRINKTDSGKKVVYIRDYFRYNFKDVYFDFSELYSKLLYGNGIDLKTLSNWINTNVKEVEDRKKILRFMIGLAYVDGVLNKFEYGVLRDLNKLLELPEANFENLINEMKPKEQDESKVSLSIDLNQNYAILGLNRTDDFAKIKDAYRKMAKLYHPDNFINESEVQQKKAHEHFLKIQEAYEYLMKMR